VEELLSPLKNESLVEVFIQRFEELILSGKISIGQRLPSERELAVQLGVSRPVVHEGLLDLEAKGLVTMTPRIGTVVNDYRRSGSLSLLGSLVNYHRGDIEPKLFESLLRLRYLIELETAGLAALNKTDENMTEFESIIGDEESADMKDIEAVTDLDFRFHHLVAIAGGNLIYPLLLNSFKQVYTNFTSQFFGDSSVVPEVFSHHRSLVAAIGARDENKSIMVMKEIIEHGEKHLKKLLSDQ